MDSSAQGPTIDWEMLTRYVAGAATPGEREAIERVVATDPAHRARIDALRALGRAQGQMPRDPDTNAAWQRALAEVRGSASRDLGRPLGSPQPSDAAARAPGLSVFHCPDASATFPRARPRGVGAGTRDPRAGRFAAIAATLIMVALGLVLRRSLTPDPRSPTSAVREYVTAAGQRLSVTLPDGTQLTLGPASRLRVPTGYATGDRTVALDGEALFAVVHDAQHPFAVRARNTVARDVGTRFVVRAYASDRDVRVVVAEGAVVVQGSPGSSRGRPSPSGVLLSPNSLAEVDPASGVTQVTTGIDLDPYTAWQDGRLVLDAAPARDALTDVARWYGLTVAVTDSAVLVGHVTASFANRPCAEVLHTLASALDLDLTLHGRTVWVGPRRPE